MSNLLLIFFTEEKTENIIKVKKRKEGSACSDFLFLWNIPPGQKSLSLYFSFAIIFNKGPFELFLFHWNKVYTSEDPQKPEKKSERAPWPCSSGTFHWNNFFYQNPIFCNLGPQYIEIFVPVECSSGAKSPNRH